MIEDRNQRSSILYLPFSILDPLSSILHSPSSIFRARFHLSLSVLRPITAQMNPTIQKRTMICGSFQPLSS
jgi:hypothetical protein